MLTLSLLILLVKIRKWQVQKELKWQNFLLNSGLGFHTKVQDVFKIGKPINGYRKICFHAMLRVNGKTVCKKMQTFIKTEKIFQPGDKILIRYLPSKMHHVMITNSAA